MYVRNPVFKILTVLANFIPKLLQQCLWRIIKRVQFRYVQRLWCHYYDGINCRMSMHATSANLILRTFINNSSLLQQVRCMLITWYSLQESKIIIIMYESKSLLYYQSRCTNQFFLRMSNVPNSFIGSLLQVAPMNLMLLRLWSMFFSF